jgi:glyoxylase-like metal-dependent hydrolase (beta-lactamase superfamily II)
MAKGLLKAVAGRPVTAHTITHAHADHIGGSPKVLAALGVPFLAPAADADAIGQGRPVVGDGRAAPLLRNAGRFKAVPIARRLAEGDEVAGFRVVDAPGHSPGHIAFWRESDRVLICGDVYFNLLLPRLKPGLREPPTIFTPDPGRNRASMRKLLALEPDIVGFGHGPVMTGAAATLRAFTATLGA